MNTNAHNMSAGAQAQTIQTPEDASTAQGTSEPSSPTQPLKGKAQLSAIDELISGALEDDDQSTAGQPEGEPGDPIDNPDVQPAEPKDLKALAEKLGTEPEKLYEVEVSTGDGESVSIGALKDAYNERAASEQEIAAKTDAISARESGLVSDVQSLGILDAMRAIPAELRGKAVEHLNSMAEREYSDFLTLYPDLQQDEHRIAFDKDVKEMLGEFGLVPEHFGVRTVGMYQLLKKTIDDRKELKRLKTPRAKTPPKAINRNRRKPGATQQAQARSNSPQGRQAQIGSIANLIGKDK